VEDELDEDDSEDEYTPPETNAGSRTTSDEDCEEQTDSDSESGSTIRASTVRKKKAFIPSEDSGAASEVSSSSEFSAWPQVPILVYRKSQS
jgi:hypothetical protein